MGLIDGERACMRELGDDCDQNVLDTCMKLSDTFKKITCALLAPLGSQ